MKFLTILLLSLFLWTTNSYAVFNFDVTICSSGCDYTLYSTAENALDNSGDLTSAAVKCGAWDAQSGSIADAAAITWDSGSSSGTLHHMTDAGSDGEYYITVSSGTLDDNDIISDGSNTITVNGAPDSCSITLACNALNQKLNDTVNVNGMVTSATNNYTITSKPSFRHTGTAATGCGINRTTSTDGTITLTQNHSVLEWLTVKSTFNSSGTQGNVINVPNSSQTSIIIRNNIVYDSSNVGANGYNGIRSIAVGTTHILNNLVYNIETTGITGSNSTGTYNLYNNTTYGCTTGHGGGSGTVNCINALSLGNTTDMSGCDVTTTSATTDTTGTLDGVIASDVFTNLTGGSEDFHLISNVTGVIDGGTDQGTTNDVQFDIDGYDRDTTGVTWDMGADEFVGAVVSTGTPRISGMIISGMTGNGL